MSNKETGGPAFPSEFGNIPESVGDHGRANGVTIRDYFAGKAMQSLILGIQTSNDEDLLGVIAYVYADKMLVERAK